MKKIQGKTLVLFLIILALVACSSKKETKHYSVARPTWYGLSEKGFIEVIDGVIWFYDFASGEKVILCNKPDCNHEPFSWSTNPKPTCLAVAPGDANITAVTLYDDHVYMFTTSGVNETTIYKQKVFDSGRKVVAVLEWETSYPDTMIFQDNMAYFIGTQFVLDEEGSGTSSNQKFAIFSLNLQTGKVEQISDVMHDKYAGIHGLKLYGDQLMYQYYFYDEEMDFHNEEHRENSGIYFNHYLYQIDLTKGKVEKTINVLVDDAILFDYDENTLYYHPKDRTSVYTVSIDDMETHILIEGKDISPNFIEGHGILYAQNGIYDGTYYFYDFETEKTTVVKRPEDEGVPSFIYGDLFLLSTKLKDGQYHGALIRKEDYFNGERKYMTFHEGEAM